LALSDIVFISLTCSGIAIVNVLCIYAYYELHQCNPTNNWHSCVYLSCNYPRSTAVYGGAGVAEQIADLKRGTHIVTATPGRLIDILTMQSGKILNLQRVTYIRCDG
jgi:hypothetical protein